MESNPIECVMYETKLLSMYILYLNTRRSVKDDADLRLSFHVERDGKREKCTWVHFFKHVTFIVVACECDDLIVR